MKEDKVIFDIIEREHQRQKKESNSSLPKTSSVTR